MCKSSYPTQGPWAIYLFPHVCTVDRKKPEGTGLLVALGNKGWGKALMWGKGTTAVLEQGTWQENTGSSERVTGKY